MIYICKYNALVSYPSFVGGLFVIEEKVSSSLIQYSNENINSVRRIAFANTVADCLNAGLDNMNAIIWTSKETNGLEGLSPKKRPYGWILATVHLPIFIHMQSMSDIDLFKNVDYQGVYCEDADLLIAIHKKLEPSSK